MFTFLWDFCHCGGFCNNKTHYFFHFFSTIICHYLDSSTSLPKIQWTPCGGTTTFLLLSLANHFNAKLVQHGELTAPTI